MEKKERIDQQMNELIRDIKTADPPEKIWGSIEARIRAVPRHSRKRRNTMVAACVGVVLLASISAVPLVSAAIPDAIGNLWNAIVHITHIGPGDTKVRWHLKGGGHPVPDISLEQAKHLADFPLYGLPKNGAKLAELWNAPSSGKQGPSLNFVFDTPYGHVWIIEQKAGLSAAGLSATPVTIGSKHIGHIENGFLVWDTQGTRISMTFLGQPQQASQTAVELLARLADEFQKL
ncbi:MAG: hypothetical protein JJ714_11500 [Acidithiobacillus sp.]|nr:hypothetical protein [Acidithiobacillus sp.]